MEPKTASMIVPSLLEAQPTIVLDALIQMVMAILILQATGPLPMAQMHSSAKSPSGVTWTLTDTVTMLEELPPTVV